jgi:transcriptional regulator with XRE-family HTH domain
MGARLREIRERFGLSQRALATRADVTNGMISLIEKNASSPSVATLKKILDVFPMSLSEFFASGQPEQPAIFFRADELVETAAGPSPTGRWAPAWARRCSSSTSGSSRAPTPGGMLRHDGEEGGVVVRGEVELTVGTSTRILRPGDAYAFQSSVPHRFRNLGAEACEIVSACTPPSF